MNSDTGSSSRTVLDVLQQVRLLTGRGSRVYWRALSPVQSCFFNTVPVLLLLRLWNSHYSLFCVVIIKHFQGHRMKIVKGFGKISLYMAFLPAAKREPVKDPCVVPSYY